MSTDLRTALAVALERDVAKEHDYAAAEAAESEAAEAPMEAEETGADESWRSSGAFDYADLADFSTGQAMSGPMTGPRVGATGSYDDDYLDAPRMAPAPPADVGSARPAIPAASPIPSTPGQPQSVLQLNPFPQTVDPSRFSNARSNVNPSGDLLPLLALRQLVDPVPVPGGDYYPSARSTEATYGQLLSGAAALPQAVFAACVLASAQLAYDTGAFPNLDGTPGEWRPVYASPDDWPDASKSDRFRPLNIDLTDDPGSPQLFATASLEQELRLRVGASGEATPVDAESQVRRVNMRYLLVSLKRPWFRGALFSSAGWYLGTQRPGFCSTGSLEANDGVLPLVPTALLLGMDTAVDADWATTDAHRIADGENSTEPVYLGPFQVAGPEPATPSLQVIGWISELMPLSPKDSSPAE